MELSKNCLTIGLDFGTTNTVVSFYKKSPIIFKDSVKDCIPTKICFENDLAEMLGYNLKPNPGALNF